MDGRVDGWKDRWIDGWMEGWRRMGDWMDRCVSGFMAEIWEPGGALEDRLYIGNEFFMTTLVLISSVI